MNDKRTPYFKNVPGDFYVEDGCCTACDVPHHYAPDLFEYDDEPHCFVARQPASDVEVYQAIKTVWASELECIRYKGDDPEILRRLAEAGVRHLCDQSQIVRNIKPLLRNHAVFECSVVQSEIELANLFRDYLLSQNTEYEHYKTTSVKMYKTGAVFELWWYKNNRHAIKFDRTRLSGVWHVCHSPINDAVRDAISVIIDDWLKSTNFSSIKWYTATDWQQGTRRWQNTPI